MRSIKARFFQNVKKFNANCDIMNLGIAVRGQGFTRDKIVTAFNTLVDKNEYDKEMRMSTINYLCLISGSVKKHAEERQKQPKNALGQQLLFKNDNVSTK